MFSRILQLRIYDYYLNRFLRSAKCFFFVKMNTSKKFVKKNRIFVVSEFVKTCDELNLADRGEAAIGTSVGGKDFGIEIIHNFVNREVMSSFATKIGVE